jgi:hypothetical protein
MPFKEALRGNPLRTALGGELPYVVYGYYESYPLLAEHKTDPLKFFSACRHKWRGNEYE